MKRILSTALLFLALTITAFAAPLPAQARAHNDVLVHGRVNLTGLAQALSHVDNPTAIQHLQQNLDGYTAILCSFECLINYAVARIRERREHHNEQLAALREALRERKG